MKPRIQPERIRAYRLWAHHLKECTAGADLQAIAGACGLQNSPPGAWETAMFNRLPGCTLQQLRDALYRHKHLLQAWSYRGAPVVFPTRESEVFLSALIGWPEEQPWIYTRGIALALDAVQMAFEDLFARVKDAVHYLDQHTVASKEMLDRVLADIVCQGLPPHKQALWNAPSMYGNPDRQTVGGAAVSFLLRPCACASLVVFGERQNNSPTFTSFQRWTGHVPQPYPDARRELVRRFVHCYGPTSSAALTRFLGCAPAQARRLWNAVQPQLAPVEVGGRIRYMLASDLDVLQRMEDGGQALCLLGAHDPYLDVQDRDILLPNTSRHRAVWQTVANPGAILRGGCIIGTWRGKTVKEKLAISMAVWEPLSQGERQTLIARAQAYADFRQRSLQSCTIEAAQ